MSGPRGPPTIDTWTSIATPPSCPRLVAAPSPPHDKPGWTGAGAASTSRVAVAPTLNHPLVAALQPAGSPRDSGARRRRILGALWPLAGLVAGNRQGIGVEILAPDMPLYGYTEEPAPGAVRYGDWIDLLCDIIVAERARDDRPIILFGASMGGMMAYEAAHRTGAVDAVLATCLLDLSDPAALAAASRIKIGGRLTGPPLRAAGAAIGSVPGAHSPDRRYARR